LSEIAVVDDLCGLVLPRLVAIGLDCAKHWPRSTRRTVGAPPPCDAMQPQLLEEDEFGPSLRELFGPSDADPLPHAAPVVPAVARAGYAAAGGIKQWHVQASLRRLVAAGHEPRPCTGNSSSHRCVLCGVVWCRTRLVAESKVAKVCSRSLVPSHVGPPALQPQRWSQPLVPCTVHEKRIDVTHKLVHFRGVIWCLQCGAHCNTKHGQLILLRKACKGKPSTETYARVLGRLNALELPGGGSGIKAWPSEEGARFAGFDIF
jgi:hypothetical protein